MTRLQKCGLGLAVAAAVALAPAALHAGEDAPATPRDQEDARAVPGAGGDATAAPPVRDDPLAPLLAELAKPDQEDWRRIEAEIVRHWSRSGSDAMDFLLERGQAAMEAGDWPLAVEHLSALVDHAPGFAEGWNARATAFYMMGEYALAIADVERVLALNPRHFGALSGLAVMLEATGDDRLALRAQRAAQAIHPHRPEVNRAIERLERKIGGAEL